MERRPRLVINCISFNDVDRAETDPAAANAVNATGAQAVAQACARIGSQLIHLSTDFVFEGAAGRPFREDDPPRPLSAYAKSKLLGERLVAESLPGSLIVRTAWLFGPGRPTFVDKVLALARTQGRVQVVEDQVGSPTYSRHLAAALIKLAQGWTVGVLHVVNSGQASRLEMARLALSLCGLDPMLAQPISSAQLGRPAPRPAYSVLDAGQAARILGAPLPPWDRALASYLQEMKEAKP
jgi:dTDP-4-dehydrorhamnose reductase